MTSTNDGKDVKSNQTSGHKSKSYYIELYKSIDAGLSSDCALRDRTRHLCEAWRRIHSLCQHSAPSTHPHLVSWLQRHTAKTVLQTEWQSPNSKDEHHKPLEEAINSFIDESRVAVAGRNGLSPPWESQLVQRGEWFRKTLPNPWGHPVLRVLLDPEGQPPSDKEVLEWLKEERCLVFLTRLRQLAATKSCVDLALLLVSAVMDRFRAALPAATDDDLDDDGKEKPKPENSEPTFPDILKAEAGFTVDVWELLTDMEFVLLHKRDKRSRCIELAKLMPLRGSYFLVERLQNRVQTSAREKKLWKNAKDVATLIAQVVVARCMVAGSCRGQVRSALYSCAGWLARLLPAARLPPAAAALAAPAATARHLHTLATAVHAELQRTPEMKPFVCELYVRAITAGMNELERLKLKTEKGGDSEARAAEQTLATWFTQLGALLAGSPRMRCECELTAFSLHPAAHLLDRIRAAPALPAVDVPEPKSEQATSEFGSWASDSRSQTNFVKTSETLNLKQIQHQANVLSTAILAEGEGLGFSTELCQDITVLLSGPRLKTLSWDMDRDLLLENCRTYMERTGGGTIALTTELKYLNLDPREFEHLPVEEEDETDIYYGIEKGYEHLVEEYHEPEEIWQDADDPERTESAHSDDAETIITPRVRRKKKTKNVPVIYDEDLDPLSSIAEAKRIDKKKERPHSKERSKEGTTSKSKMKPPKDPLEIDPSDKIPDCNETKKDAVKEKKKRKKKDKTVNIPPSKSSLSSLVGMKVSKIKEKVDETKISVSDSDYDSQGKSSLNSLNLEGNDPDVLFDGLFSMDEIKSPDRNSDKLGIMRNNEVYLADGSVTINSPTDKYNFNAQNVTKDSTVVDKLSHSPRSTVNEPLVDMDRDREQLKSVTEKVKNSITRLIQYRRQKALNELNQLKSSLTTQSIPDSMSTSFNKDSSAITKLDASDRLQIPLQITPKVVEVPEIPKVYINKNQSDKIADLKNEVDYLLNNQNYVGTRPVIQYAQKPIDIKLGNISIQPSSKLANTSLEKTDPKHVIQKNLEKKPISKVQELKTRQTIDKSSLNKQPLTQKSFQKFLHELQKSINAGTRSDSSKSEKRTVKKEIRPMSKVTPVLPYTNKDEPNSSPQSAKQIVQQQKKPENALNTFSRLSYMHKSNKMDSKLKELNAVIKQDQALHNLSISDIEQIIHAQKVAKHKYLQASDTVTSRVKKPPSKSNEKRQIAELKNVEQQEPAPCTSVAIEHPLMSSLLQCARTNKQNASATRQEKQINDIQVRKTQDSLTTASNKTSALSEKDQNELLLLLRQKRKQNATLPRFENTNNYSLPSSEYSSANNVYQPNINTASVPCHTVSTTRNIDVTTPSLYESNTKHNTASVPCHLTTRKIDVSTLSLYESNTKHIEHLNTKVPQSIQSRNEIKSVQHRHPNVIRTNINCKKNEDFLSTKSQKTETLSEIDAKDDEKDSTDMSTDWESVMNLILSHKTPSRGPNALEMALNKDVYDTSYSGKKNLSQQRITPPGNAKHSKPIIMKVQNKVPTSKSNTNVDHSTQNNATIPRSKTENVFKGAKFKSVDSKAHTQSSRSSVLRTPIQLENNNSNVSVQTEAMKKQINNMTATKIQISKKSTSLQRKPSMCTLPRQEEIPTSGIPNSEYDLLEELMDDELRQEIGELSDDENYNITGSIQKVMNNFGGNNKTSPVIQKEKFVYTSASVNRQQTIKSPVRITKCENVINSIHDTTVHIHHTSNLESTALKHPSIEYKVQDNIHSTNLVQEIPRKVIVTRNCDNNVGFSINNHPVKTIDQTSTLIAPMPQPTALQNVVLFGTDIVYQPCTIQAPIPITNLASNTYVAFSNQPNMTLYQTTQFTTPVVNPLIIGNAITVPARQPLQEMYTATHPKLPEICNSIEQQNISKHEDSNATGPKLTFTNQNLVRNDSAPAAKSNLPHDDVLKSEKEIFNLNCNKGFERKVLSEVQEQLSFNEKVDTQIQRYRKLSVDHDSKKETTDDKDRLRMKRIAILNRNIYHRCDSKPIPLTYAPLEPKQLDIVENPVLQSTIEISLKKPNVLSDKQSDNESCLKEMQPLVHENECESSDVKKDDNVSSGNNNENFKENKNESSQCRRILLRSSNRLPKVKVISIATSDTTSATTKVRLKSDIGDSKHKLEENTYDKITTQATEIKIQDEQRKKKVTTTKSRPNREKKISSKKKSQTKLIPRGKILIKKKKLCIADKNLTIAEPTEAIDVEEQIVGSKIPRKVLSSEFLTQIHDKNDKIAMKNMSQDKGDVNFSQTNDQHQIDSDKSHKKQYVGKKQVVSKDGKSDIIEKMNLTEVLKDNMTTKKTKTKNSIRGNPRVREEAPESEITSITSPPYSIAADKDCGTSKDPATPNCMEVSNHIPDSGSTVSEANNGQKTNLNANSSQRLAQKNINSSATLPQSYKDNIIIENLPDMYPGDPHKKCVRIRLPTGRIFKATMNSKGDESFDTLFSDPIVKKVLLSNLTDKKRYTLNIQHVATTTKHDNDKILKTRVQEINLHPNADLEKDKNPQPVETISLLSDEEEEESYEYFKTEFGSYKVKMDKSNFQKHQKRLLQKCFVKLKRLCLQPTNNDSFLNQNDNVSPTCFNDGNITDNLVIEDNLPSLIPKALNNEGVGSQIMQTTSQQNEKLDNSRPTLAESDVIEIDDSSNDSFKLNSNGTVLNHDNDKITELKGLLLKDLGIINQIEAGEKTTGNNVNNASLDLNISTVSNSMPTESSPLPAESDPIPAESNPVPIERNLIPIESNPLAGESDPIPAESNSIPIESNPLAGESDPIPAESNPIPIESNPLASASDPIPAESNPIPIESDPLPTNSKTIPAESNQIPTESSNQIPTDCNPILTDSNSIPAVSKLSPADASSDFNQSIETNSCSNEVVAINSPTASVHLDQNWPCFVKLQKCDDLVRSHEQLKCLKQKCFVKLYRCDQEVVDYSNKRTKGEAKEKIEESDKTEKICKEIVIDDILSESTTTKEGLSRSGSFSILNEFTDFDIEMPVAKELDRSSPVIDVFETIAALNNVCLTTRCNSPVMNAFETIVALNNNSTKGKFTNQSIEKIFCESEWYMTKYKYHDLHYKITDKHCVFSSNDYVHDTANSHDCIESEIVTNSSILIEKNTCDSEWCTTRYKHNLLHNQMIEEDRVYSHYDNCQDTTKDQIHLSADSKVAAPNEPSVVSIQNNTCDSEWYMTRYKDFFLHSQMTEERRLYPGLDHCQNTLKSNKIENSRITYSTTILCIDKNTCDAEWCMTRYKYYALHGQMTGERRVYSGIDCQNITRNNNVFNLDAKVIISTPNTSIGKNTCNAEWFMTRYEQYALNKQLIDKSGVNAANNCFQDIAEHKSASCAMLSDSKAAILSNVPCLLSVGKNTCESEWCMTKYEQRILHDEVTKDSRISLADEYCKKKDVTCLKKDVNADSKLVKFNAPSLLSISSKFFQDHIHFIHRMEPLYLKLKPQQFIRKRKLPGLDMSGVENKIGRKSDVDKSINKINIYENSLISTEKRLKSSISSVDTSLLFDSITTAVNLTSSKINCVSPVNQINTQIEASNASDFKNKIVINNFESRLVPLENFVKNRNIIQSKYSEEGDGIHKNDNPLLLDIHDEKIMDIKQEASKLDTMQTLPVEHKIIAAVESIIIYNDNMLLNEECKLKNNQNPSNFCNEQCKMQNKPIAITVKVLPTIGMTSQNEADGCSSKCSNSNSIYHTIHYVEKPQEYLEVGENQEISTTQISEQNIEKNNLTSDKQDATFENIGTVEESNKITNINDKIKKSANNSPDENSSEPSLYMETPNIPDHDYTTFVDRLANTIRKPVDESSDLSCNDVCSTHVECQGTQQEEHKIYLENELGVVECDSTANLVCSSSFRLSSIGVSEILKPEEQLQAKNGNKVEINKVNKQNNSDDILDEDGSYIDKNKQIMLTTGLDSGILLKGIEYNDPEMGTCYMFPLVTSISESSECDSEANNYYEDIIKIIEDDTNNRTLKLNYPKITYSKHNPACFDIEQGRKRNKKALKRKTDMSDIKIKGKKYRKGKGIDYPKITTIAMTQTAYSKEFKSLFEYISSIKFSYSMPFHKDLINVHSELCNWPINNICNETQEKAEDESLFVDIKDTNERSFPNPKDELTLAEEIVVDYNDAQYNLSSSGINESNFNMGFGEGSDRVIQNLEKGSDISKFSAATLSDVKQSQPLLVSEGIINTLNSTNDEIEKLQQHFTYMRLRERVRSFFRKTKAELTYDWIKENEKDTCGFPYGLNLPEFIEPCPVEAIVQVVQVGQLPVSAAAQNPVTCDPRVTQVSDVSPSQCSAENSSNDDPQSAIKTEYTELTTADLSLPLVQDYAQHNQVMPGESHETSNLPVSEENIPIETEIKSIVKIELMEEIPEEKVDSTENEQDKETQSLLNKHNTNNINYSFANAAIDTDVNTLSDNNSTIESIFDSAEKQHVLETFPQQKQQNGSSEKTDQIAHAMNAAGITTTAETITNTRAHALVNILSQKIRQGAVGSTAGTNTFPKTTSINAMALQQALAQILPPPLNQTNTNENQQTPNTPVTPQVLHIVQSKNAAGNQITLVDNTQQSVISTPNSTPLLHIVQNKGNATGSTSNGTPTPQSNTFSGLSLVDTGLQQGGNQLLHIVNTGSQKNTSAGQLLKRVNLLTNLQGSNEQKMVQFVCKSADGKAIQLNAPHQRGMVLRLQPIESPNIQSTQSKTVDSQDISPSQNTPNTVPNKETIASQQEIKSRSIYEENYAKFIQNSSNKTTVSEKATSLPKFNQAFGKQVFQDGSKQNEINNTNSHLPSVNNNNDPNECQSDNAISVDHISQMSSPPLLLRKSPAQTSQAQQNLVQQIKQTIAPMNLQTMHGGVIYTRQIPVNIGAGQTINLITVPSTELIDDSAQKQQTDVKFVNQGEIEPSIIKIVPQTQTTSNSDGPGEENNVHMGVSNENSHTPQPQPVLTQMRIKLPMLSKTPQMVSGARVVRPSFFQIQRNVIGGANQPVYQQLVLTAAPPLGQQTLRLPQTQTQSNRQIKVPAESQSSESQMSSSTLEQLREFDLVLEQVKERSTVQPNANSCSIPFSKLHTPSTDSTDGSASASSTSTEPTQQVLYSVGNNQPINVAYVNRKASVTAPATSTFVRSPESSGIADSPTSSTHIQLPHTVTSDSSTSETPAQSKTTKVSSKSKSRPKSSSNPPNTLKLNTVPPKTSAQKPLEDEQTTQRILYILAEYKEQVENSPDKDKPAPRRRSNPPSNPSGSSKRKKSSSGSRRPGVRDISPVHGEDTCRTMGSEDSSCGTSQGDCNESCMDSHSPEDSPRKVVRKLTFEQEIPTSQPRPQPQRNVIVADGQTITVARGTAGKPATAVLMPANYILPVSMVKGGQQIAIVTNRGPKLLTVGGGEGGATNALLLQRLIGPAGLKPVLARPGVRHVRLPTAALHNLQAFNLATATTVQPPDSTASPAPAPTPPDLVETRAASSPWTDRESQDVKPERGSSPEGSEPWNLPSSADPHDYTYEETVRADNMDRTVLDTIPDQYSPDMEAQRIFDKMFDVDSKKSYMVDSHDDSPRCGYDIDGSDCDDKAYHQVVHKKDGSTQRQHRLTHVSAAALRHKYAILEHELRLQKSLSEECEDLGVDSPSASELFPEAELLFAASPAHDHTQEHGHHSNTPQPTLLNQSGIPQPDIDDQIATDQLLTRSDLHDDRADLSLGLEDVGIVTVSEDGMQATIALDQEEFARSHPNTTFHSEPTDDVEVQPFTISGLKGRHITSTIFHSNRTPGTVLMTAPQTTVISQATAESSGLHNVKYDIDNMINSLPSSHTNNINLSSVLVKDDGLARFDNILNDTRELHLSNTASAIVHAGNATQVIRRVCYDDDKRDTRFLIDEPDALIAGDDAKMIAEDSSRDATLESIADVDDDRSTPERHTELFWESNSASERSESRRPLDFSSDSDKCCKSPFDETNSTDSSGVGGHMRLDSVIKEARVVERSGSADGSSADDTHPPLRTYPPKRLYHSLDVDVDAERSTSGKTRAGERSPDSLEVRRRASARGVVKRGCHCCNGSPAPTPPRPKKPRQRKPTLDFTTTN